VFSGVVARILRGALLSEFQADYARTARAKGAGEGRVLRAHVLRNAALPAITVTGLLLGDLLGGAIVTEAVFNLPGLGSYMVEAVLRRDFPEIQGTVLVVALAFVLTNLLVDGSYAIVDPRIRYE
jgi:peptide/nickel transport system permease protein